MNAIAAMVQTLGKKVVAEGIETPEQLEYLKRLNVALGQGYLLGEPMHAEAFSNLLGQGPDAISRPALSA